MNMKKFLVMCEFLSFFMYIYQILFIFRLFFYCNTKISEKIDITPMQFPATQEFNNKNL